MIPHLCLQNITQKTKDRVTRTPLKAADELRWYGKVNGSCSTSSFWRPKFDQSSSLYLAKHCCHYLSLKQTKWCYIVCLFPCVGAYMMAVTTYMMKVITYMMAVITYMMAVIPEQRLAHQIIYLRFYCYSTAHVK